MSGADDLAVAIAAHAASLRAPAKDEGRLDRDTRVLYAAGRRGAGLAAQVPLPARTADVCAGGAVQRLYSAPADAVRFGREWVPYRFAGPAAPPSGAPAALAAHAVTLGASGAHRLAGARPRHRYGDTLVPPGLSLAARKALAGAARPV
jgi:hypothetical protein